MPTNRIPISRPRHRTFTPEILTLFAELENTPLPRHWRKRQEYMRKSQRLAGQLGLSDAWWMGLRVEKINEQRPREGLAAYEWWPTVRRVRRELLTALEQRDEHSVQQPADEPEPTHPAA
jgi:hypothetical protein